MRPLTLMHSKHHGKIILARREALECACWGKQTHVRRNGSHGEGRVDSCAARCARAVDASRSPRRRNGREGSLKAKGEAACVGRALASTRTRGGTGIVRGPTSGPPSGR